MSNPLINQYAPDYVSHPGETLEEILEERQMSQAELAERMGRPKKTINEIIKGNVAITPDTALQLERVLGTSASFWNNRECLYRETLAKQAERERLQKELDWLKNFPTSDMVKKGWIKLYQDKVEQLRELLSFFGVASPEQWEEIWQCDLTYFRQSAVFETNFQEITAWLRQGEIQAAEIICSPYNAKGFKEVLQQIRTLTVEPPEVFKPEVIRLCAKVGVAVVFVPELPKTRTCGATRWLNSKKAIIQLSLRYKTDDHLWFSFYHEAGHISLHGKRDIFIEKQGFVDNLSHDKEQEANEFACNMLIPKANLEAFISSNRRPSKMQIRRFATQLGIAPGILVGRLQHDGVLPNSHCNDLKQRFEWVNHYKETPVNHFK